MIYLYIAAAIFLAYYVRRFWLAPWARYVRHSVVKASAPIVSAFLTVKRVHWYPPFLEYEETWHSNCRDNWGRTWFRESDGAQAANTMSFVLPDRASRLTAMLEAARAREVETEELAE